MMIYVSVIRYKILMMSLISPRMVEMSFFHFICDVLLVYGMQWLTITFLFARIFLIIARWLYLNNCNLSWCASSILLGLLVLAF